MVALTLAPIPVATSAAAPKDRAAIDALLDERAEAIVAGDREAFLGTIHPEARSFRARQMRLFEGLQSIPLASYELSVDWDSAGDLVRRSDRRRYSAAEAVSIPMTLERYALSGVDEVGAAENLFYTFVLDRGRWSIADDDDLEDVGLYSSRRLWDQGRVETERRGRFLLLEHPCDGAGSGPYPCAGVPDDFLDLAGSAMEVAEDGLEEAPMPRNVAIVAPGNQAELARILQATYPLENFLAFAASSVDTEEGFELGGHRILLNWERVEGSPDDFMRTILSHELIHVGTRGLAGPFTPSFVDEGIAEYVSRKGEANSLAALDAAIAGGTFDRKLPRDHEFRVGGPESIFLSYKESQSAITFLIEGWGHRAFVDFYRELGSQRIAAGTTEYHVDRALRSAIGMGLQRFERAWADSIT